MRKTPVATLRRSLAYIDAELAKPDIAPGRREALAAKRPYIARQLEGRCRRCGRPLRDPSSVAEGIGPECVKAAS